MTVKSNVFSGYSKTNSFKFGSKACHLRKGAVKAPRAKQRLGISAIEADHCKLQKTERTLGTLGTSVQTNVYINSWNSWMLCTSTLSTYNVFLSYRTLSLCFVPYSSNLRTKLPSDLSTSDRMRP